MHCIYIEEQRSGNSPLGLSSREDTLYSLTRVFSMQWPFHRGGY